MLFKIPRLYDSHTHFLATGEFAAGLNLGWMQKAQDVAAIDLNNPAYYRGDWLIGFGWDDKAWPEAPHKNVLDKVFPDRPVFFARNDGHRCWVNSKALEYFGVNSETGILTEKDHLQAWERLPAFTFAQERGHILAACGVFNNAGFTHVRDMSCTDSLWNSLCTLADRGELTVAIEENYTSHSLQDFDKILKSVIQARQDERALVRCKGVKVFFDGSLGSETAYLSKPYRNMPEGARGRTLWELSHIEEILKRTWAAGLEFSVHTIGDEAAHLIVQAARKISAQGAVGRLNLEHTQLLRPETIQMMKPLHVRCHLQPCHWLSDRVWLEEKLGDLYRYVFPWEALRAAQIPMSFGCDSPIEPPSFWRNKVALDESVKAKIKKFTGDITVVHAHPDPNFAGNSYTIIENDEVREIVFNGKPLELSLSKTN
ncbi:amidohydrolase family protein [Bdellovibrio sp. 22V]|uniref:amidohydrolase n=1 Tax=Bdellovibrio TaxID=958 RepID=UPI0025433539|nr:amidohydrolase family protein [Bdellovibrio sp. 22V]WII73147.1 amidohydrolase family protein [Bdellovibrio sp. 22V]